jgi:hypothetical protein
VTVPLPALALVVFAHAGHWLLGLAYFFPVLVLIAVIALGKLRDRQSR